VAPKRSALCLEGRESLFAQILQGTPIRRALLGPVHSTVAIAAPDGSCSHGAQLLLLFIHAD